MVCKSNDIREVMLRNSTTNIHIKKSKLHISELWFFSLGLTTNVLYIILMVVFAFKCSVTYKIKSAISNPQKSFPEWWYDMTMCMNLP